MNRSDIPAKCLRFDDVPSVLCRAVQTMGDDLRSLEVLHVVRDLFGRIRLLARSTGGQDPKKRQALENLARLLAERLGRWAYPPDAAVLSTEDLAVEVRLPEGERIFEGPPEVRLIDRTLTGRPWGTVREADYPERPATRRLAFYSLKGGVGRSTAVAVAAWHLAKKGLSVLVLDLDLEAPGLTTSLLPPDRLPEFGVVDWFVEDAVGQGADVLGHMAAAAPLATDLGGQIWVVPSHGRNPGDYLAKLGRCYLDLPRSPGAVPEEWTQRLVRLVAELEKVQEPDVVLLDVRSGLPDLSAVPVTDLGAEVLLFALDTDQTWAAYRLLFEHWRRSEAIRILRERLHIVAAMVPETERKQYMESFRQRAWDLFRDHAYDEVPPPEDAGGAEEEAFSFDLMDEGAPHTPVPIYWNRGLATLANLHGLDATLVEASFGAFLQTIGLLVAPGTAQEGP